MKIKKRKSITSILLALCIVTSLFGGILAPTKTAKAAAPFTSADFLKTNGTTVRNNNGNGNIVHLRGTNAGGWLVQENWMNPTNAPDQKTMMDTFKNRFGATVRDELIKIYEDNYWTTQDFDNCANMGMSVIRLPFTYMNLTDDNGNLKSNAFERLDWFISNCSQRGIYVILDLHGAFGSQNGQDHSGIVNDGYQLWNNQANMDKTVWLWQQIAARYKGNPTVAAYDLLNEPGPKGGTINQVQWNFYDRLYKAVRAIDPDHIIMIESCWDTWNLPHPSQYGWTNVIYQYHNYPWGNDNNYQGQVNFTNGKIANVNNSGFNVPTFVGEFTCFVNESAWNYTMQKYNEQGWGWTTWAYKATGTGNSWGIYNHNPSKVDIYNDSANTIRSKWASVGASNSTQNTMVYNAVKAHLPGTVNPSNPIGGEYQYLVASSNGLYVCAEDGGNSPLKASRPSGGDWEKFRIINNSDGTVSLQSFSNGKYVCAVIDEQSQLLARSGQIGTWEKFWMTSYSNGQIALRSLANNLYVQANPDNGGLLTATGTAVNGAWEVFTLTSNGTGSGNPSYVLANGNYSLQAVANNKYISADNYGNNPLIADRDSVSGWETFEIVNNTDGTISIKASANGKYVCAVIDEQSQLLARGGQIGTWEKFKVVSLGNGEYGLQAVANNKYVKADLNGNGVLKAVSTSVGGAWEAFKIVKR